MNRSDTLQAIFDNWGPLKRLMHANFLQNFGSLNLSPAQVGILKIIACGQPISHKALAQKMQLTPGGLSQQLEGLEAHGLVRRTPDPSDRRVAHLSLSTQGEQKLQQLHAVGHQLLSDAFAALDDSELAVYLKAQRRLIEQLEQHQTTTKQKEN